MRLNKWWILGAALSLLPVLVVADTRDDAATIRWDIIHIVTFSPSGKVIAEGGMASALAQNKSTITLTGSGTFTVGDSDDVTGGGTWQTVAPPPESTTHSGTYRVTRLVRFDVAPAAHARNPKDPIAATTLPPTPAHLPL